MKLQLRDPEKLAVRGKPLMNGFTKDGGFTLYEKGVATIGRHGEFVAFADHHVDIRVETAGDFYRRITATRMVLTGLFALAWQKKKDNRSAFVTVDVDYEPRWVQELDPQKQGKMLEFATRLRIAQQT